MRCLAFCARCTIHVCPALVFKVWYGIILYAVLNCDALLRCSAAALGAAKKFPVEVVVVYARVERALFGLCACGAAGGCGFDAGGFGCDGLPWKLESMA